MPPASPTSIRDIETASGARVTTVEEAEKNLIPAFPNLPLPLASMLPGTRSPHPAHRIVNLPDGRVHSHHGTIIDAGGHLVLPLSREIRGPVRGRRSPHRLLTRRDPLPDPIHVPGRTLVLACASAWKNYFHWMIDALPRLRGIQPGSFDRVFTPCAHPFHRETLALAGLDETRILPAGQHTHIHAEELVVPTLPPPGRIGNSGLRFLRELLQPLAPGSSTSPTPTRLFLGREDTWNRRLANAAELHGALEARGFRILHGSRLTVRQQAEHLSRARIVVAPHGAALANLVFCRPGTSVVECFASDYIRPHYHDIAGLLGLDYHAHWTPGGDPAAREWTMDIPGILELVDRLLMEAPSRPPAPLPDPPAGRGIRSGPPPRP